VDDGSVRTTSEIVAVEADVQIAKGNLAVQQLTEECPQASGEKRPAPVDADEGGSRDVRIALGQLVRDSSEHALDVPCAEDDLLIAFVHGLLPGLTGPG
jgi:hypothetical protein